MGNPTYALALLDLMTRESRIEALRRSIRAGCEAFDRKLLAYAKDDIRRGNKRIRELKKELETTTNRGIQRLLTESIAFERKHVKSAKTRVAALKAKGIF